MLYFVSIVPYLINFLVATSPNGQYYNNYCFFQMFISLLFHTKGNNLRIS